jgi:hypothetical protein
LPPDLPQLWAKHDKTSTGKRKDDSVTPESELKKSVTDFLTQTGEFFLRINTGVIRKGSRYIHLAPTGTPDILIFRQPLHWIELKAGKTAKDRAEKQAEFREKVLSLGHKHITAKSLEDVQEFLGGSK